MTSSNQRQESHKAYQRASHTVSKTRQVVMLYDGAIRFLQQAREHMVAGEIEGRYHKLVRVGDILMALQSCLDFEAGGEPAKVLYDFYALADTRILTMHRTGSVETCDQVIRDLKAMRDVWDGIDRSAAAGNSATIESTGQDLPNDASKDPITFSA
jgi:flagellar protein FliS